MAADTDSIKVDVAVFDGVTCSRDCSATFTGKGSFTAVLTGNTLAAGQTRAGAIKVTAVSKALIDEDTATQSVNLTVKGPAAVQTVKKVSGTVVDSKTGDGISGASVGIRDGGGHTYDGTTNGRGTFTFNGTTDNPITPGSINIVVFAKDFEQGAQTINGANGQTVSEVSFKLASTKAASPTPTPSATPSETPSATPSAEESEAGTEATAEATDDEADANNAANSTDDDGGIPWVVILIGALLVAVGVGTIVLLFIRRKQDKEADAAAVSDYRNNGPGAAGGAYGASNDATRIGGAGAAGVRPGGMDDATRITNPMSEAPTMITSRAAMDEFPDPYGAPPPGAPGAPKWAGSDDYDGAGGDATRVGYGDDRGGYGSAGSASVSGGGGYGDDRGGYDRGGYGSAGSASVSGGGGYGGGGRGDYNAQGGAAGAGGYGAGTEPYDDPTGRYNGGADGYGGQGGGYGANPPGPYGQRADQGGYGAQEIDYGTQNQGGGYGGGQGGYGGGAQGSAGQGAAGQGGYGGGQADDYGYPSGQGGGYGAAGGQGGYGDRGGYDQGGYDQQAGGYDQGAGGYGAGQSGYPAQQGGDRAGYDHQQAGGYDQGGNRGDNRGNSQRGDRRIDWMDD